MLTLFEILDGRAILASDMQTSTICTYNGSLTLQLWRRDSCVPIFWDELQVRTLSDQPCPEGAAGSFASKPATFREAQRAAEKFLADYGEGR